MTGYEIGEATVGIGFAIFSNWWNQADYIAVEITLTYAVVTIAGGKYN